MKQYSGIEQRFHQILGIANYTKFTEERLMCTKISLMDENGFASPWRENTDFSVKAKFCV